MTPNSDFPTQDPCATQNMTSPPVPGTHNMALKFRVPLQMPARSDRRPINAYHASCSKAGIGLAAASVAATEEAVRHQQQHGKAHMIPQLPLAT